MSISARSREGKEQGDDATHLHQTANPIVMIRSTKVNDEMAVKKFQVLMVATKAAEANIEDQATVILNRAKRG